MHRLEPKIEHMLLSDVSRTESASMFSLILSSKNMIIGPFESTGNRSESTVADCKLELQERYFDGHKDLYHIALFEFAEPKCRTFHLILVNSRFMQITIVSNPA